MTAPALAPLTAPVETPAAPMLDAPETTPASSLVVVMEGADRWQAAAAISAVYGDTCPLVGIAEGEPVDGSQWAGWVRSLWDRHADPMREHLHDIDRCRRFREGEQWLSRLGNRGAWREPPKSANTVRYVHNVVGPALDWRLQVLNEQRPGFRASPSSRISDPSAAPKSVAAQRALDTTFTAQAMPGVRDEAAYYAQTDGVAFLHTWWDRDAGQTDEVGLRLGDMRTTVHRLDDVRVSANASATRAPDYWVLRETIPLASAVLQYGAEVSDQASALTTGRGRSGWRERLDGRHTTDLLRSQELVERYTVYCAPSRYVPEGMTVVVVGQLLVHLGPLPCGVVPMVRVTDGTKDPAFFPRPQMWQWLELQQALNAALSKWLENIRKNAGGRYLARANAIVQETMTAVQDSVIEVRSPGPIGDVVLPVSGFSVGKDTMDLISWTLGRLEDLSGFTPSARGSVSGDASGRAILAAKESLERHFAGAVMAMADALTSWAKIQLAFMRHYYEVPRLIAVVGDSRPDLVQHLRGRDLDGVEDVGVDAETLMPLPRSLKLFQLNELLAAGALTIEEYRRRYPMASLEDLTTPNAVQEAYALRIVEAIRRGEPLPPVVWPEDEAIGQTVLERELIFAPNVPEPMRQAALARWDALAQQGAAKAGMLQPPAAPALGAGPTGMEPPDLGANTPTGNLPVPLAAAPLELQPQTVAQEAAAQFEQTALQ